MSEAQYLMLKEKANSPRQDEAKLVNTLSHNMLLFGAGALFGSTHDQEALHEAAAFMKFCDSAKGTKLWNKVANKMHSEYIKNLRNHETGRPFLSYLPRIELAMEDAPGGRKEVRAIEVSKARYQQTAMARNKRELAERLEDAMPTFMKDWLLNDDQKLIVAPEGIIKVDQRSNAGKYCPARP